MNIRQKGISCAARHDNKISRKKEKKSFLLFFLLPWDKEIKVFFPVFLTFIIFHLRARSLLKYILHLTSKLWSTWSISFQANKQKGEKKLHPCPELSSMSSRLNTNLTRMDYDVSYTQRFILYRYHQPMNIWRDEKYFQKLDYTQIKLKYSCAFNIQTTIINHVIRSECGMCDKCS